ncbi:hypothetical protein KFU94_10550 [Chloroflexi bacterium TSY]|nr:hypothetical protein [Chloroflexi bacterium TSY]
MANIARCILDSADKTNVSRYLSEAPWRAEKLNDERIVRDSTIPTFRVRIGISD